MSAAPRLLAANTRLRPARALLTALAVVASSCLVVWVVSGYDALIAQSVDENAAKALGRFDLIVLPAGAGPRPGGGASLGLSDRVVEAVRRDGSVDEANLTSRSRVSVGKAGSGAGAEDDPGPFRTDRPPVNGMPPLAPPLIGTDAAGPPYDMVAGRWLDPAPAQGPRPEGVLSAGHASTIGAAPGDALRVVSEVGEWTLTLVGVVEQPEVSGGGDGARGGGPPGVQSGLFVSPAFAEVVNGHAMRVERINVVLKRGVDASAHRQLLADRLAKLGAPVSVVDLQAARERLARSSSASGSRTLAYSATGMALMAALFIIFTTLSMGVSERARELAVLRAVGLTRGQVAALVFLEALALALVGWLGGLVAGWGLLAVVARARPELFADGAALGPWCVGLTAVAALGGAIAAAVVPAWRATRVAPLDAMAPPHVAPPARWVAWAAAVGPALLAVGPVLVHLVPMSDTARTWAYALVAYPSMVVGSVLLAPAAIVLVEAAAGPVLARLLGLPPRLLASVLTANLWRTLGTTVALAVGLGLFVATQTWGYSMLAPFTPGDWVPEMLVGFEPAGLPDDQIEAVRRVRGVVPERCLALAVEQPRLARPPARGSGGSSILRQDNVVVVGLDPELAFGGDRPMLAPTFTAGDRASAVRKLMAGRACVVPDHFLESSGLKLGDALELVPPGGPPGRVVSYEVVGAVSLPGWHWLTKMTGLRRRLTRAGALVFAPIADVRRDFDVARVNFFWLDTDGQVSPGQVEAAMQTIAEAHGEARFDVAGVGEVTSRRPYARLTSTRALRASVGARADGIIWGMSEIPLVTLLIASLAVVNTVASSVRARRYELGVLRALGTTRGGLVRLILAEALLIGLVVCVLGLGFGVLAGWSGIGMARYLNVFGGMPTPLVLPWGRLALGLASALGLCLVAAVWPAVSIGRAEPLALLQSGRTSA